MCKYTQALRWLFDSTKTLVGASKCVSLCVFRRVPLRVYNYRKVLSVCRCALVIIIIVNIAQKRIILVVQLNDKSPDDARLTENKDKYISRIINNGCILKSIEVFELDINV